MSQCDNPITYKVFNVDLKDIVPSENKKFNYLTVQDQASYISGKNYVLYPYDTKLPYYLLQNTNMYGSFGSIYDIVEIVNYAEGLFAISKKALNKGKLHKHNKDPFSMKIKISKHSLIDECKVIHDIYKNKNHRLLKNTNLLELELVELNNKKVSFNMNHGLILNSLRKMEKDDVSDIKKIYLLLKELEIINNKNYLHNDLKPDNILYDKHNNPIIIDYGSAKNTKYSGYSSGTLLTMSPEAMLYVFHKKMISKNIKDILKSDIYSLGSTIFYLLSKNEDYFSLIIFKIENYQEHSFLYQALIEYYKIHNKNNDNDILEHIKENLNIKTSLTTDNINNLRNDINTLNINNIAINNEELKLIILYFMLQIDVFKRASLKFILELIELYNPKLLVKTKSKSRRKSSRKGKSSFTKKRSLSRSISRNKSLPKRISANNLPILF